MKTNFLSKMENGLIRNLIPLFALATIGNAHAVGNGMPQYRCEESLPAEFRIFASDMAVYFIEVRAQTAETEVSYQCTFGYTGSTWASGPEPKRLPCTLSASGGTVLVKDSGSVLRLAIDEMSYISRHFSSLGSDKPMTSEFEAPFAGFATIREEKTVGEPSTTNGFKMNGYRLDCKAI